MNEIDKETLERLQWMADCEGLSEEALNEIIELLKEAK